MNWKSIDTAPKNVAVLTDEGFVIWSAKERYGIVLGWIACDRDGVVFNCCEEGPWEMAPKWWMEMPKTP